MDNRKIEILRAIVTSYINFPNPVGSRTISKEFDLGVSSATIRNEMADLEDLGYLNKPHTSAGRVPSDKAYRFFVDQLEMQFENYSQNSKTLVEEILEDYRTVSDLYRNAVRLLSDESGCISFMAIFKKPDTKIKFINLFSIDDHSLMLLIVGDRGIVERQFINVEEKISDEDLSLISEALNTYLSGIDFTEVEGVKIVLKGRAKKYQELISEIIKRAGDFKNYVRSVDFYYDGLKNILSFEEDLDVDRVREFMDFVEDRDSIPKLVDTMEDDASIEVVIGEENSEDILKQNSIIRSVISFDDKNIGKIGIVGPVRMDYKRNIDLVRDYRDAIGSALTEVVG